MDVKIISKFYHFLNHKKETELRFFNPTPHNIFVKTEKEFIDICKKYDSGCNLYVGVNERSIGGKSDENVIALTNIFIDIDPKREKDTSSTDAQLEEAKKVADEIFNWFIKQGFEAPNMAMSGNGWHIYATIPEIKITDANRELIKQKYKALGAILQKQFDTENIHVDSVFNLSRIAKVIGTLSCKGEIHRESNMITDFSRKDDSALRDYIMMLQSEEQKTIIPTRVAKEVTDEEIKRIISKDEKLGRLYSGNTSGYDSRSEAEMALIEKLIWWEIPEHKIEEIMSSSGLGKWSSASDKYRKLTIQKAYSFVNGQTKSVTNSQYKSNNNNKFPPTLPLGSGLFLGNNRGEVGGNNEDSDLGVVTNSLMIVEEQSTHENFLCSDDYATLKARVSEANSNITMNVPYNLSWKVSKTIVTKLYEDTGKLVFLITDDCELEGRIVSIKDEYPKEITLLSEMIAKEEDDPNEILFLGETNPKKLKIGLNYVSSYYAHIFKSKDGRKFTLLSKKKLEPQHCIIKGMVAKINDNTLIGESRKITTSIPLFFVKEIKPNVLNLTDEQYLELIKDMTHDILLGKIAGKFRHPLWFEKLVCAFLFNYEYEGYGLNLFVMADAGTGKSSYLDALSISLDEGYVFSGTASTMKGLVPSFASATPEEGYLAKCRRVALIDEFLRLVSQERRHDDDDVVVSLGKMNELLEHRKRKFGSGKGFIEIKATANAFIVTNPAWGIKNAVSLANKIDRAWLSRFLLYFQNKTHIDFINQKKKDVSQLGASASPETAFDVLSICDYFKKYPSVVDEKRVSELFEYFRLQVPEGMLEVYDARGRHHILCLIDGLAKYHAILRHDKDFKVDDIVIDDFYEIFGALVSSWNCEVVIKKIPQKIRKHYLTFEHRIIFDLIEQSGKITEEELKPLLSEKYQKNLYANILQLRHDFDLIKRVVVGEKAYLVPYWFDENRLSGDVTVEENENKTEEKIELTLNKLRDWVKLCGEFKFMDVLDIFGKENESKITDYLSELKRSGDVSERPAGFFKVV